MPRSWAVARPTLLKSSSCPLLLATALICTALASAARAQAAPATRADASAAAADDVADLADLEALLNQPVYAASKFAQDAARAPASVTVLTAGDIRAHGWRTIAEVLNAVRGVNFRYDRFYRYVGVRGLARPGDFSSRLLMLIDGLRINDNIYDQAGVGREFPLDVALIERVEFIPGPGSALYGSNAVLGVVNIVTRSGAAVRGDSVHAELSSDNGRLIGLTSGREFGSARLLLSAKAEVRPGRTLYFPEYDAPQTRDGLTDGGDRETDRKLYARWTQGGLTATGIVSQRRKQIPTGAFDTVFGSRETYGIDAYAFADLQWQHMIDATQQLLLRGGVAQYSFDGSFDYGPADGRQQLEQRGRWASVEARWLYSGWRGQRIVLGVEAQRNLQQRQRSSFDGPGGGLFGDVDGRSSRFGLFVNDEIVLRPGLNAVLGLRLDRRLNGQETATPRVALLWEPTPALVLKLLGGRAYREPNAFESQFEDITAQANPGLRSETLKASELAAEWRALPNLRLAASLYRYRVADLIEQEVDAGSGLLVFNNVGAVRAEGSELEADYVHASGWRARASWSEQNARDRESGARLTNSPRSLAKLHVTAPLPLLRARLGLEVLREAGRTTLAGEALATHAVANLTLQVTPPASPLSFAASVYNLFDRDYADPGGPELRQDRVAQDGRRWRVQLTVNF